MELLSEGGHLAVHKLDDLLAEAHAIMSILGKAEKTAREKRRKAEDSGD